MNDVFKNAKFGDFFKTRQNGNVIFLCKFTGRYGNQYAKVANQNGAYDVWIDGSKIKAFETPYDVTDKTERVDELRLEKISQKAKYARYGVGCVSYHASCFQEGFKEGYRNAKNKIIW